MIDFTFTAPLWLWKDDTSWHFITVPEAPSAAMKSFSPDAKRGFGSVRVTVQIGDTRWNTSVFPNKSSGGYVWPIKKAVRHAESLKAGDKAFVQLELII